MAGNSAFAAAVLNALANPLHGPIDASHAMVVVAHPDDETLILGGQLPRLAGLHILHVTDGAPRDGRDSARSGFSCPADYAAARRRELDRAMTLAGVPPAALSHLLVPDQEAAEAMGWIALHLRDRLHGMRIVFTHAMEGGHPDHDAVALAVGLACELIARRGAPAPTRVESPLYREGAGGWERRSFADEEGATVWRLSLTPEQEALKKAMLACFVTQAETLNGFPLGPETFRLASSERFAGLPNGGRLLYEREGWGMTGIRFLEAAERARRIAGLEDAPCG